MNDWRKTLQQQRLTLIQQHTRGFAPAAPATAATAPMVGQPAGPGAGAAAPMLASGQPADGAGGGGAGGFPAALGDGKSALPPSHLAQYQQRALSFSSTAGGGGGASTGGSGRYNGLSSNFFDSIRSFLSQSSMRSGSTSSLMGGAGGGFVAAGGGSSGAGGGGGLLSGGFGGAFLGNKHRHPPVEIRLLRPSMKAGEAAAAAYRKKAGERGEGVDGHTLVPVQELQVRHAIHHPTTTAYTRVQMWTCKLPTSPDPSLL